MVINILKFGLLITAAQLFMASSCGKDKTPRPCANGGSPYSFNVTSEFTPEKEVYNIGDTIIFTSSFPKTLLNLVSNQQVDYSNSVGIGGGIYTGYLDTITHTIINSLSKFIIIDYKGTTSPISNTPEGGKNTLYANENFYTLKLGIVLKNKGIYRFAISDLISQGLSGQNCSNAGFNMTVTNSNKHLNLFNYAIGYYPDSFAEKTMYCFRVQ